MTPNNDNRCDDQKVTRRLPSVVESRLGPLANSLRPPWLGQVTLVIPMLCRAYLGNSKLRTSRDILTVHIPWACARRVFRGRQSRRVVFGNDKNVYEYRPLRNSE